MWARVGVVDVEQRLVGREAEPVRLYEVVDEQLQLAAARRDAVDALEVEILLALDAEAGHPAVGRIAEVDRAARVDHDVVRAVQLLALVVGREHLTVAARAVGIHADDRARRVLADDQAALGVERHAVALVARLRHLARRRRARPAAAMSPGMSLNSRYCPAGFQIGPSVNVNPVPICSASVFGSTSSWSWSDSALTPTRGSFLRDCAPNLPPARPGQAGTSFGLCRVPSLDPAEDRPELLEAGEVVAGQEPVDVGQRGSHAGRERLVLRAALERVDPDDRERLA